MLAAACLSLALLVAGQPGRAARRSPCPSAPPAAVALAAAGARHLGRGHHRIPAGEWPARAAVPRPSKQTITVNVTYLVGSRHENYGETGMAHLLEHMVFKGTPRHKDIPSELAAHGARPNGTTSWDRTNYFETFNASEENLRWALDLEADRMVNSLHREEGPRQRDDRGAQRIRDGREPARSACCSSGSCPSPTTGTTTATRPSARARTSKACRSTACRPSTRLTTSRTTRCCWWPARSTKPRRSRWCSSTSVRFRARRASCRRSYTVEPVQDGERLVTLRRDGRRAAGRGGLSHPCGRARRHRAAADPRTKCWATPRPAGCTRRWSSPARPPRSCRRACRFAIPA